MRLGISLKLLPGIRVGYSFGGRRRSRIWASERLGPVRLTESTTTRKRRGRGR